MGGWQGQAGPCQVPAEGFQERQTILWLLEGLRCCLKTHKWVKVRLRLKHTAVLRRQESIHVFILLTTVYTRRLYFFCGVFTMCVCLSIYSQHTMLRSPLNKLCSSAFFFLFLIFVSGPFDVWCFQRAWVSVHVCLWCSCEFSSKLAVLPSCPWSSSSP